jgi:hypothetical protein
MGGESSKPTNSSGSVRSREHKRSGLSSAFAGGDCRTSSNYSRPSYLGGPSYGSIPEHIPAAPVKCAPVPIAQTTTLDKAFTWIPDTEAMLVTEWNRERQEAAAPRVRPVHANPNGDGDSGGYQAKPTLSSRQSSTTAGEDKTTVGGVTSSVSSSANLVPLNCDYTPAATGRSTGLVFRGPVAWVQPTSQGSAPSPVASSSSPSSPKPLSDKRSAGGDETSAKRQEPLCAKSPGPSSSVVVSALPVGIEYYRALQARWATPELCHLAPAAEEEDLNDSVILEAVAEPDGNVLSPPVPLGYMIDLFVPQWRAEGLFEQAESGNQGR